MKKKVSCSNCGRTRTRKHMRWVGDKKYGAYTCRTVCKRDRS